jgi:hypothetical protein
MFQYVTDTNRHTWSINVSKITKVTESDNVTLIYFDNGDIIKTSTSMLDLVSLLNGRYRY